MQGRIINLNPKCCVKRGRLSRNIEMLIFIVDAMVLIYVFQQN